jgi:bacterioferritin-associated ferredoxin
VRVLTDIKKLDDCFGQFLVRVSCVCGSVREIEPEALARLGGWSTTLEDLALRLRCSQCGKKAAEVVAVARPRQRRVPKNPH